MTNPIYFSCILDDFQDYIYEGFVTILNKSRSANVGVMFSHQSLGDLEKVSPDFKQIVVTNTNIKVIMRSNDPDSAEQFAKIIGTKAAEKTTSRRSKRLFGSKDTGEQSVREVEEYVCHPNTFKSGLGRGEGILVLPYPNGRIVKRVAFAMAEDLPTISLPIRDLPELDLIQESTFRGSQPVAVRSFKVTQSGESKTDGQRGDSFIMRFNFLIISLLASSIFISGCASTGKSIGAGALGGAALGGGVGAIADPGPNGKNRIRNVLIGSAIGSVVGAGAGYLADHAIKEDKDDAYKQGRSDAEKEISARAANSSDDAQPKLVPAKTEARWIPDQVRGSIFIPGHFEYLIIQGAHWESGK